MPREVPHQEALVEAVKKLELTSELFEEQNGKLKYAGDLEVIVRGRDYGNGKRVGPYMRLLVYDGGEEIMRQGEWGGNTFYIGVEGTLEVFIDDPNVGRKKINELQPGTCLPVLSATPPSRLLQAKRPRYWKSLGPLCVCCGSYQDLARRSTRPIARTASRVYSKTSRKPFTILQMHRS